ncbi:hypothetical protein EVAR_47218_1 [Eumeta japonica]|uniref:Uncharacterized protein n=1 Tax=Eumeta variegata TaxID=151549 RepID=A0A4C1XTH4_EUMVA|nr:hypothetical protein EVAR_47218_1 [Eumeta japonica]
MDPLYFCPSVRPSELSRGRDGTGPRERKRQRYREFNDRERKITSYRFASGFIKVGAVAPERVTRVHVPVIVNTLKGKPGGRGGGGEPHTTRRGYANGAPPRA